MTTSSTPLNLASLLSDLHHLSSNPSLLPSLPERNSTSSPSSDTTTAQDPSTLAVTIADSFLVDSQQVLYKLDSDAVQRLGDKIDAVEHRVDKMEQALR
ncbi:BQ2448_7033 [Microbotryum intermedium]|uniref:BQ2448_7033 protein n=1 Tax=Microbotryum intermedium TaxID=269621 RepID=A0A238FPH7_9BASI|nr:BQ2448_7033 [Microbotryum intermedium]